LISSEEITDGYQLKPVHVNATNIRDLIKPQGGDTVLAVIQNNVNAVLQQRDHTGRPMFPHVNHPNFGWAITAEDLMQVVGERFFEVYNGHPLVRNEGDETHASTELIWDIVLTRRLTELNLGPLYALAVDDAHNYYDRGPQKSNPGRGWVMVRAAQLTPEDLIGAMEAGEFYATSGVRLKDVQRSKRRYEIIIEPEEGVSYTTQFIGTRKGFDRKSDPVVSTNGEFLAVTRRYSSDIGKVFAEAKGNSPSYKLKGDEIYVRAKVISSKLKVNPYAKDEVEVAWTQPIVLGDR
jgi:hypothetical protein